VVDDLVLSYPRIRSFFKGLDRSLDSAAPDPKLCFVQDNVHHARAGKCTPLIRLRGLDGG
jgi:hypothetical protein